MKHEQIIHYGAEARLDHCLRAFLLDYSRTFLEKLIEDGFVMVNNRVIVKSAAKVKEGDHVTIRIPSSDLMMPAPLDIEIIFEHEDFIILNKPAGVLTHPSVTAMQTPSVLSAIYQRIEGFADFNDISRPGIVHRLDKDTSGVLIVAKNPKAFHRFGEIFQQRRIHKYYLTVVAGIPQKNNIFINKPIGRDPRNPKRMTLWGIAAKEAKSEVTLVESFVKSSLLRVQILTGRTHQIRVHLASQQLFVLGDETYGAVTPLISRQALHAHQVKFMYNGKSFEFYAPVPDDFTKLVDSLRV